MGEHSLFDDLQRSDLRSRFNAEPSFPYLNVSGRSSAAHVRGLTDAWYLEMPEQDRTDLRARFRSPDDVVHLGAFTELYCAALLRRHGFIVDVHANASSKGTRIDFLATRDGTPMFLLESVSSGGYRAIAWQQKLTRSLYDQLNKLQHPDFFVMAELRRSGTHSPSGRKARHYVDSKLKEVEWEELWLASESGNEAAIPEWVWETDGWEISFKPIPKSPQFRGIADADSLMVGVQMDPVRSDQPGAAWLDPLEAKASRYGEPELPYIIAVNGLSRNYPYQTLGSKQGTILDESHRSITHERRQPSHRAYKTICRRGELAFDGQRRWLSPRLHSLQTPRGTHLALGCLSSPLMTSRIIATLVLDGARRYAPTLAGIPPGTLPPQQAETPTSWHARSPASEVMVAPRKSRRTLRSNWSFKGVSELSPIGRLQRDCGIQN